MITATKPAIADSFILPSDVVLTRVDALDDVSQRDLPRDHLVITRPRGRSLSGLITPSVAALLRTFESAHTIVEAVVAYSEAEGLPADTVLEDAFAALRSCIHEGFLVPADSPLAEPIGEALEPGATIADHEIVSCVALLEDTEVYDAIAINGSRVAIKLLRKGASRMARHLLNNERTLLTIVPSPPAVALLATGVHDECPYLILEWIDGQSPIQPVTGRSRAAIVERVERAIRIVDAFAELHAVGIIHGDVHPANVLMDETGRARILDYGFARRIDDVRPEVGGTLAFNAPEALRGHVDTTSEQYSVAAIAFMVTTGHPHLDLDLDRERALDQIATEVSASFEDLGFDAWPELDAVFRRALHVDPTERFASMAEFADALRRFAPSPRRRVRRPSLVPGDLLVAEVLKRFGKPDRVSELSFNDPHASVFFGAAGTADAIARIGRSRNDLDAVHAAELLIRKARAASGKPGAWTSEALEITDATIGTVSPYHRRNGVAAVEAFIASTLGDAGTVHTAIEDFATYSTSTIRPGDVPELALGHAGTLLWTAEMLQLANQHRGDAMPLANLGDQLETKLKEATDAMAPIAEGRTFTYLGMAHGWAGLLYANLRWNELRGTPVRPNTIERVEQLIALRHTSGHSTSWAWTNEHGPAAQSSMLGWCNGGAGHIALLLAAHRMIGDDRYLDIAAQAARPLLVAPAALGTICCGTAGCMYALAALSHVTGDDRWRRGAERLVDASAAAALPSLGRTSTLSSSARADQSDVIPHSVFKGPVGLAMAIVDLRAAERDAPWIGFTR